MMASGDTSAEKMSIKLGSVFSISRSSLIRKIEGDRIGTTILNLNVENTP